MCIAFINNACDNIIDVSFEECTPPVADRLQVHDGHHQEMTAFWKKRRQLNRGVQQGRLPERFQSVSQQKSISIGLGTSPQISAYDQQLPSHTHAEKTGQEARHPMSRIVRHLLNGVKAVAVIISIGRLNYDAALLLQLS